MSNQLFDIGVNLTSACFHDKESTVISSACESGVNQLILIGSDIPDSKAALKLASKFENCYSTAGIHPHQASTFGNESLSQIKALTTHNQVKAIGETGLDFNRNYSPPDDQLRCFEAQLQLAAELQLPLYLHQRDAHAPFIALLKQYRADICDAVIHCFTGSEDELKDYLALDLHIGITGWICDERRGLHLQDLVKLIPAEKLMLETDAPYLLPRDLRPKPKKGKNEPRFLPHILKTVSHCLNQQEAAIAEQTTHNAQRFFRLI